MALFFSNRDSQFVNRINRELIQDLIDVEVDYYKLDLEGSSQNLYGESKDRYYFEPVVVPCLVARDVQVWENREEGDDYQQSVRFGLLRDYLKDINLVPQVGDIVGWDSDLYHIDSVEENEYFGGKNEDTWNRGSGTHGFNVSIIAIGHKTRDTIPKLSSIRSGVNPNKDQKSYGTDTYI